MSFIALQASAATITGPFGLTASGLSSTVMFYAGSDNPIYPYDSLDAGAGTVSAVSGFTTLAGQEPFLTMEFGDVERLSTTWTPGGCVPSAPLNNCTTAVNTYGEADAGPNYFDILLSGTPILTGQVVSVITVTDTDPFSPGFATATGSGTIQFTGGLAPYWNEVQSLTGGTGIATLSIASFNPICAINADPCDFVISSSTLTFVPEPGTGVLLGIALGALGAATRRRRR